MSFLLRWSVEQRWRRPRLSTMSLNIQSSMRQLRPSPLALPFWTLCLPEGHEALVSSISPSQSFQFHFLHRLKCKALERDHWWSLLSDRHKDLHDSLDHLWWIFGLQEVHLSVTHYKSGSLLLLLRPWPTRQSKFPVVLSSSWLVVVDWFVSANDFTSNLINTTIHVS